MKAFRVGVDSYSLKPLGLDPFELLNWAVMNEAQGVQFSESPPEATDKAFLRELSQYAAQNGLYLEWGGGQHIPFDLTTGKPKDIFAVNRAAAEQAAALGVRTVRSCSGGLMRWDEEFVPTEVLLRDMAGPLADQKRMLNDNGVILAIETHFEFTTFELLRLFEMCAAEPGDYLGICLDTMNLLTMLEDPASATRRILPWVVTTHVKDGGLELRPEGFVSFVAEAGRGVVDFKTIFRALASLNREIRLSVEDHGGHFVIPIFDRDFLGRFPDLAVPELAALIELASKTRDLMGKKALAPTERERWPALCHARVKRDLLAIRNLASEAVGQTA
jgi:sugar phosphate isomerase/epimerase